MKISKYVQGCFLGAIISEEYAWITKHSYTTFHTSFRQTRYFNFKDLETSHFGPLAFFLVSKYGEVAMVTFFWLDTTYNIKNINGPRSWIWVTHLQSCVLGHWPRLVHRLLSLLGHLRTNLRSSSHDVPRVYNVSRHYRGEEEVMVHLLQFFLIFLLLLFHFGCLRFQLPLSSLCLPISLSHQSQIYSRSSYLQITCSKSWFKVGNLSSSGGETEHSPQTFPSP